MRNMITDAVIRGISDIVGNNRVVAKEPMSKHTTFRIGGNADIVIEPADEKQIAGVRSLLSNMGIPYVILGNGSNVLVGDKGIRGAVIILGNAFSDYVAEGEKIIAKAGIKLSRLANFALENELSGLEFAAGIPGTLGGALYMNAGAYGGEMKQIVESVSYIDENGEIREKYVNDCRFGYRTSIFVQNPDWIITGCKLKLYKGNKDEIRSYMEDLAERRTSKQPLNFPSAGSTFKRPEGHFAGKLIQDAGLMGYRVGGACVSEKHAGFVVNDRNASAKDVRELIEQVKKKVYELSGVELEPEVKFIGEF